MAARPDPKRPLTISIHGTFNAGKSLISEALAEEISGNLYKFKHLFKKENQKIAIDSYEIQFIDIAITSSKNAEKLEIQKYGIKQTLRMRSTPGALFVHNATYAASEIADIDIRLGALNNNLWGCPR